MTEVFVRQQGRIEPARQAVEPSSTVDELAALCAGPGARVWIEGGEQPLDGAATLEEAGVTELCTVHVSSCVSIEVEVNYNGEAFRRSVAPVMRVAEILQWAAGPEAARIESARIPGHVLKARQATARLAGDIHVGSLAADGGCAVRLDLAPDENYEG